MDDNPRPGQYNSIELTELAYLDLYGTARWADLSLTG
jgi:hypothetical protein